MKQKLIFLTTLLTALSAFSTEYFVDASRFDDTGSATNWATAKKTIQAAVDLTANGDTVWVTNGTYSLSAEISVTNAITVRSVNGSAVTIVDGNNSTRCFNLGRSACLIKGFTIVKGFVSGDVPNDRGGGLYCENTTPIVSNCVIRSNSASEYGGGMCNGTAEGCEFINNWAGYGGGGMLQGVAHNCAFSHNVAEDDGGGMTCGIAYNCTFSGNSANGTWGWAGGGGMSGSVAYNCIAWDNTAKVNEANFHGTTASYSCSPDLTHGVNGNITNAPMLVSTSHIAVNSPCAGAGNQAYISGTDVDGEVWQHPPSMGCDEPASFVTGPIQVDITGIKELCLGFSGTYSVDIQGAVTQNIVDFGDGQTITNAIRIQHTWTVPDTYEVTLTAFNDEYPQGISSSISVHVYTKQESAVYVSSLAGSDSNDGTSWEQAKKTIQAGVDGQHVQGGIVWVTNGTYLLSAEISVTNAITIRSVNGPDVTIIDGGGGNRCFNLSGECLISGFTITNGFASGEYPYWNGGGIYCSTPFAMVSNCVISGNSIGFGNDFGISDGGGMSGGTAIDCIFRRNTAGGGGGMSRGTAYNCSFVGNLAEGGGPLFNNPGSFGGGGMGDGTAYNCTFTSNSANWSGGGMFRGTAYNCLFKKNSAGYYGGGMDSTSAYGCLFNGNSSYMGGGGGYSTWYNCTFVGNISAYGAGISGGTAYNCVFSDNTVYDEEFPVDIYNSTTYNSCSSYLENGVNGNITNAPLFVDAANGDFRLLSNSPCINWGDNSYVTNSTDLDGNPRIIEGTVDMGAYEYQGTVGLSDSDSDGINDGWERAHGGNQNPERTCSNGVNSILQAYVAGLDPNDPDSRFQTSIFPDSVLRWNATSGRVYAVYYSTNLVDGFQPLETNIPWSAGCFTDSVHNARGQMFYKLDVRLSE